MTRGKGIKYLSVLWVNCLIKLISPQQIKTGLKQAEVRWLHADTHILKSVHFHYCLFVPPPTPCSCQTSSLWSLWTHQPRRDVTKTFVDWDNGFSSFGFILFILPIVSASALFHVSLFSHPASLLSHQMKCCGWTGPGNWSENLLIKNSSKNLYPCSCRNESLSGTDIQEVGLCEHLSTDMPIYETVCDSSKICF